MSSITSFITSKILFTIVIVSLFMAPVICVWGIECSDMLKTCNSILSTQVFDARNDLKEELMNLRHKKDIPIQFNCMSKHEYRYFIRGQIYAHECFLDMIQMQYTSSMFND